MWFDKDTETCMTCEGGMYRENGTCHNCTTEDKFSVKY